MKENVSYVLINKERLQNRGKKPWSVFKINSLKHSDREIEKETGAGAGQVQLTWVAALRH